MAYDLARTSVDREEASDITDKGDVLRLAASSYTQLTSLYVLFIFYSSFLSQGQAAGRAKTVGKAFSM